MAGDETRVFRMEQAEPSEPRRVLIQVYEALREKGYSPIGQMAGYLASGEPVYVTAHKNARSLIRKVDRLELIEELLRHYLEGGAK